MTLVARLENLTYFYPDSNTPVLDKFSLDIEEGEFLLVIGSSGSGKSTLCRCFNGLVPHFSGGRFQGDVIISGLSTLDVPTHEMAKHVGVVFQDPENQFVMSDVENEIAFGLENLNMGLEAMKGRIDDVLGTLGIIDLKGRRIDTLSGGEKQKVVVASLLAMQPKILVLDEPTSQLDPKSADEFLSFLKDLNTELGITVVLTEHRIERIMSYASRVLDLDRGKVGSPKEILSTSRYRPPIVELALRLRDRGHEVDIPLSINQAKREFAQIKPRLVKEKKVKKEGKPVIEMKDVSFSYGRQRVVSNISLTIRQGEFVALIGRNGCGKTTLVKHLNGLIKPQNGTVIVNNKDTRDATVGELAKHVGYVSQNPNEYLFSETVEDELRFTMRNLGIRGNVDDILGMNNLLKYKHSYPKDLSGGERQKVALASVLIADPDVIVIDEPTRGVDHESKVNLMRYLCDLKDEGKTIILVTHDIELITRYVDRTIVMENGKITADGSPSVLCKSIEFKPQIASVFPGFLSVNEVLKGLR